MILSLLLLVAGADDSLSPVFPDTARPRIDSARGSAPLWGSTETWVALGTVATVAALVPLDESINEWATTHRSMPSRQWAAGAKLVGDGWPLILAGGLWGGGAIAHDARLVRASVNGLESWIATEMIVQVGKYGLHRHRPSESSSNTIFDGPGVGADHVSFPSGHSGSAWGLLPAYALEYSDHPWIAGAIYAVAASTSMSRVHDGKHWSSDVAFSAGLGWITNSVVRKWNARKDAALAVVPTWSGDATGLQVVWSR